LNFDNFSFSKQIRASIGAFGYRTPTPIQARAIPAVLAGKDVMGLAETGTGKTAAFALPISQSLLAAGSLKPGRVRTLVLAPTRELALQIHQTFEAIGKKTGIFSAAVYGGVSVGSQAKALRRATVVVACPGRLLDLMNRRMIDLSDVDTLVVDEADRMFDMGFVPDLRKIMAQLPAERQNLMFSATMPAEVKGLCSKVLRDPEVVQVADLAPPAAIHHSVYPVPGYLKPSFLESLLGNIDHDCVLVFARTKHSTKNLAKKLERKGWPVTSLQGNLSQNRRQEALDGFRSGRYRIMIATDIAARGIDCPRISHVINYDLPENAESYTHRIGRTGRAERSGEAMTLCTDDDRRQMKMIERALGRSMDRCRLDDFDYRAPAGKNAERSSGEGKSRSRQGTFRADENRRGPRSSAENRMQRGQTPSDERGNRRTKGAGPDRGSQSGREPNPRRESKPGRESSPRRNRRGSHDGEVFPKMKRRQPSPRR
jgi:superfamily II DNA/RNA helicase